MKKLLFVGLALIAAHTAIAQWKPVDGRIMTKWAELINPDNVLAEYPRPQMVRTEWQNLNGLWDYAIAPRGEKPEAWDGEILVPFAAESALSGVGKRVGQHKELWYNRTFTVPAAWAKKNVILHFGAVDWEADVWVNDVSVGSHKGGYTAFSFDITSALNRKGENTITVRVWDPTTDGHQPRGKQHNNPNGIWYTPVTGIWQTVWLEPVAESHIAAIKTTPDLDSCSFSVEAEVTDAQKGDIVEVIILNEGKVVAKGKSLAGTAAEIYIAKPELWSPENPHLYDMQLKLVRDGKVVDSVGSYTAMRKYSIGQDKDGIMRLMLNNKPIFHYGPLDQGWWPDGLYTAPSDEALAYDVEMTKEFGYNMIRKHVKVEPARWYYHCDRLGMIVWQDMPSGDYTLSWQMHNYFVGEELVRSKESEENYRREWKDIIDMLYSFPSIGVWVPFNEAWGQFKTVEIVEWTKAYDPTRLVNPASGGNHFQVGDIIDTHHYPNPKVTLIDSRRASVLGEYGGIGYVVKDHLWEPDRNWGYITFNSPKQVTDQYITYAEQLKTLIKAVFSAAVYTQTTDVEVEVNGLMTYDRKVVKVEQDRIRKINQEICHSLDEK